MFKYPCRVLAYDSQSLAICMASGVRRVGIDFFVTELITHKRLALFELHAEDLRLVTVHTYSYAQAFFNGIFESI